MHIIKVHINTIYNNIILIISTLSILIFAFTSCCTTGKIEVKRFYTDLAAQYLIVVMRGDIDIKQFANDKLNHLVGPYNSSPRYVDTNRQNEKRKWDYTIIINKTDNMIEVSLYVFGRNGEGETCSIKDNDNIVYLYNIIYSTKVYARLNNEEHQNYYE